MIVKTPPMGKEENIQLGKRLGASRREAGLSVAEASEIVGIPVATIKAHEKGARGVKTDVGIKYARAYAVDSLWLLGLSKRSPVEKVDRPLGMPVVGILAAGVFQARDAVGGRASYEYDERIPVQYDPTYDEAAMFACRITGTGMNREYPDGSYVICASIETTDARLGDHVVCVRYHADLCEFSIRELERNPRSGALRMASLSNDPRYLGPIALKEGEAEVMAVVIASYHPRLRRGQTAIPAVDPLSAAKPTG